MKTGDKVRNDQGLVGKIVWIMKSGIVVAACDEGPFRFDAPGFGDFFGGERIKPREIKKIVDSGRTVSERCFLAHKVFCRRVEVDK